MSGPRCLYVLRHAKSSWDEAGLRDHDRPLAPRGRRAVRLLAEYMESRAIEPQLTLCSTARRTRETLEGLHPGGEVLVEQSLYEASCSALIERLHMVPLQTGSVMIVGHNPAMQMLVLRLVDQHRDDPAHHLQDIRRKFPAGALATLVFDAGWDELRPGCAELADYVRPKALQYQ